LSDSKVYFLDYLDDSRDFDNIKSVIHGLVSSFVDIDTLKELDISNHGYKDILIAHIDSGISNKELVKLATLNKKMPVVILSAKDSGVAIDELLGYNFDYFIVSEFDKDTLVGLLNNIILRKEQEKKINDLKIKLEKKNKELELKYRQTYNLANFDPLTNLPNRRFFTDKVQESIIFSKDSDKKLALMFIDLDNFKYVNDSLGHEVGDKLLLLVTQRVKEILNKSDTLSRLGGDEFTIIIEDYQDKESIARLAQNLIDELKKVFVIDGFEVFIGSSVGISLYPQDSQDYKELIKFADTAMYYVKNHGKNSYVFFNEDMTIFANDRLEVETNIRKSIENKEFVLLYQPKINLTVDSKFSVEALIRFDNSVLKDKPLAKCIDIAEETGLIIPITYWIIEESCRQIREWIDLGYEFLRVSINISTRMFKDDSLIAFFEDVIKRYRLKPTNLEIEITETTLMDYIDKSLQTLQKLSDIGIKIAIDDFGTGYSSMSYLKTLPIDFIKIDKSFVSDIHTKKGKAIVTAIIAMAKSLDIKVVAEGVEDIFQLEFLKQKGCDIVQGYYYSKPLRDSQIIECIASQSDINSNLDIMQSNIEDLVYSKKLDNSKDISIVKVLLTGFSLVSKEYGYDKENEVLEAIEKVVKSSIRADDIFSRISNEEFLILIQSNKDIAQRLAQRVQDTVHHTDFGLAWKLNTSIYVTSVSSDDTKESILQRIDKPVC
jgi:diguanylate cyclase (GGDEF)-like protein